MNEPIRCETCGGPLPQGALGSACPRCLFSLALASSGAGTDRPQIRHEAVHVKASSGKSGLTIGPYRLLRRIGAGAMGAVYEAQQDHPRRTVALKLFRPKLIRLELFRRFERESQALARLQHPGIAQLYEAGTADTAFGPRPYFSMELIKGARLLEYVEKYQPSTGQMLEIVAKVCDAVHHAHQRGLIHRDLKPANIMVDSICQPKVLDFGVARITDCNTLMTPQTTVGQLVGTLAYMSPEQALANPMQLDQRSDVYTLGIVLYELLSGRLPYDVGTNVPDALRAIGEEDPPLLGSIDSSYRGNLETIVAKALEKDKARRYSSAAELASDLRQHLQDEPIVARPPSSTHQP